jgi:predicted membrane-bound spermidine synthase
MLCLEVTVYDEFKFLGLAPLFGVFGALATAAAWQIFAFTLLDQVPAQLEVLSCLVAGLVGPLVVWLAVWIATRRRRSSLAFSLRRSASVGLGLVLAAELGFYIPLGFFAIAFH